MARVAGDRYIFAEKPMADTQDIMVQLAKEGPRPFYVILADQKPRPPMRMVGDSLNALQQRGKVISARWSYRKRFSIWAIDDGEDLYIRCTKLKAARAFLVQRQQEVGPALRGFELRPDQMWGMARIWANLRDFPGQTSAHLKGFKQFFRIANADWGVDMECLEALGAVWLEPNGVWVAIDPNKGTPS